MFIRERVGRGCVRDDLILLRIRKHIELDTLVSLKATT